LNSRHSRLWITRPYGMEETAVQVELVEPVEMAETVAQVVMAV